tara:strand:- start:122 stop:346 length:225 start_codon:yes stop_codon:yes gene_type:complete
VRRYGDIGSVYFVRQGYNIYNLAYEYKLVYNGEASMVYVNNMTELREEIRKLEGDCFDEQQDQVQVPPMQQNRG